MVEISIWTTGLVFLGGLLFGVGGAFFLAWIAPRAQRSKSTRPVAITIAVGLAAGPLTVGLQGVDTIGGGIGTITAGATWLTGLLSGYGTSWLVAEAALTLGLASMFVVRRELALGLSAVALLGVGISLSLRGDAGDASPADAMWALVLLHVVAATFWIGSLIPLAVLFRHRDPEARAALRRFSGSVPFAVVPLVAAGLILASIQLTKFSDLWMTAYGAVLSAKLLAVAALFGLAAINRSRLARKVAAGDRSAAHALSRSISGEWVLAVVVVALVAGFRVTPSPRSLFAAAAARPSLYAMAASADAANMANVNLLPGRVGLNNILVQVTDRQMRPIVVAGLTISIADPDAGIEPITRTATKSGDTIWRVDGITLPVAGLWTLSAAVLLPELKQVDLATDIEIGP